MNLEKFENRFGTEKQCLDYLYQIRWNDSFCCPRCGCNEMWEIKEHKYKCKKCSYQTTVIAGTLFHGTHIPINVWFHGMWYINEKWGDVTIDEFQKELGLGSNRTALKMINKIKEVMHQSDLDKLRGVVEIDRYFLKLSNIGIHLMVAVEINNKKIGRIRANVIHSDSDSMSEFVRNCIDVGSTIVSKYWYMWDKSISQDYIQDVKYTTYKFKNTYKVYSDIKTHLSKSYVNFEISEFLEDYCLAHNNPKTKIPFDEMLKNAVLKSK